MKITCAKNVHQAVVGTQHYIPVYVYAQNQQLLLSLLYRTMMAKTYIMYYIMIRSY